MAYQDNGVFFLLIIKDNGEELANLNVSNIVGLDDRSKPITGFYEPLITCTVHDNDQTVFI